MKDGGKIKTIITIIIAAAILIIAGFLIAGGKNPEHFIIVVGSTSVQPYAEMLAEEFERLNPGHRVDVQGGGSSTGIQAVQSGTADIGMSSRGLKDSEKDLWSVEIAKDGLAVIIHPGNEVQDLDLEQIRGIYAGEITNWKEVGGPDKKIHIIAREEGSGTRDAFESLVMGEKYITPKAIVQSANGSIRQLVSSDRYSIGFISLGLVDETVTALKLNHVEATCENVINGSYTLFRSFLFVALTEPEGTAKEFIDFVLSAEGQEFLISEGLIPTGG